MRKSDFLCILAMLFWMMIPVSAATSYTIVSKSALPYEISGITSTTTAIRITGWGLLNETQHFIGSADHSYELEFVSLNHSFTVPTTIQVATMTDVFRYGGVPICATTAYFKTDATCYYRFENVGFTVDVPFSSFQIGQNYTCYLIVHAKNANSHKKIAIFFPMESDLVIMKGQTEYRLVSKLDDTKLTIKYETVVARTGPDKSYPGWQYGANCSSTYGNTLFFKANTVYSRIVSRYLNQTNKTTYYGLSGQPTLCENSRRRVAEGNIVSPMWIPSGFVDYSGTPLTIKTSIINQAPTIFTTPAILKAGESFDWRQYVSATDPEEGSINEKIIITSDNYHNQPGNYVLTFSVSDSYGAQGIGTLNITVLQPDNTAPILLADDFSVLLNASIDYHDYARAIDVEDGDLSDEILVSTNANLEIVGVYPVCYSVRDSRSSETKKCVYMTVFDIDTMMNRFRFVDKYRLFYNESIPTNWIGNVQLLNQLLNSSQILESKTIVQ